MKLIPALLISIFSFAFVGLAQAQFTVNFPDEITLEQIKKEKLTGINYQVIKRKNWPRKFYKSTSFFISKNCLLTSAHNLEKKIFHPINHIRLYPSCKTYEQPFGSIKFVIDNKKSYKKIKWNIINFRFRKRPHDLALIYVPDTAIANNELLKSLDYLPLLDNPEDIHVGDTIYSAGYPAVGIYAHQAIMIMKTSTISEIHSYHFTHQLETLKGNSGSPVMVKRNGQFYVIGVNSIHFQATWLNEKRQKLIQKWMKELEELNK